MPASFPKKFLYFPEADDGDIGIINQLTSVVRNLLHNALDTMDGKES
jgi:hypothetical protein